MENTIIPKDYSPQLTLRETEVAIKRIKDYFERMLAQELNLTRVSAPLFVKPESGLNDNLNGVEKAVSFEMHADPGSRIEIVHSLAKWKRMALYRYDFHVEEGLYTDMNAIRTHEELDNLHSIYVDQWDWEKIIARSDRTKDKLKDIVEGIYGVFKKTEEYLYKLYPQFGKILPEEIFFITTQELEDRYPGFTPKEREDAITREKGAVFLMEIGHKLASGMKHDGRSPDYDDWTLNGDILFFYPLLDRTIELSSMGIRVDEEALEKQLTIEGCEDRRELDYHRLLLEGKLPCTVGGGIGQSRMCMFFMRRAHIGEVQASVWPEYMREALKDSNIFLL